jgi:hypothetical protein
VGLSAEGVASDKEEALLVGLVGEAGEEVELLLVAPIDGLVTVASSLTGLDGLDWAIEESKRNAKTRRTSEQYWKHGKRETIFVDVRK